MNIKRVSTLILISSSLVGCAFKTHSSGVLPIGPDTFSVSADDLNASTAKRAALSQAQAIAMPWGRKS